MVQRGIQGSRKQDLPATEFGQMLNPIEVEFYQKNNVTSSVSTDGE